MRFKSIEEEASWRRDRVQRLLSSAAELDLIAKMRLTSAGIIFELLLEQQVETWRNGSSWSTLDDEAKREQGKALRSRELLEYLRGAEEEAKRQRAEVEKETTLLETAANQGRISRV